MAEVRWLKVDSLSCQVISDLAQNFKLSFRATYFFSVQPPFEGSRTSRRAAVIVAPNTKLDYRRRKEYDLRITVVDNVNKDFSNARLSTNARVS